MLRWLVNLMAVACVIVGAAWFVAYDSSRSRQDLAADETAKGVRLLEQMIKYRATQEGVALTEQGYPRTIDPAWFEQDPPINALLSAQHPWVEVAPQEEAELLQPPVRQAIDRQLAGFWYNPHKGIVRARVPVMVSDAATTELYNRINGTNLTTLFAPEKHKTTGPQHASAGK